MALSRAASRAALLRASQHRLGTAKLRFSSTLSSAQYENILVKTTGKNNDVVLITLNRPKAVSATVITGDSPSSLGPVTPHTRARIFPPN